METLLAKRTALGQQRRLVTKPSSVLILADLRDRTARDVAELLRARLPTDVVRFVTPSELLGARRIAHRVSGSSTITHWSLEDGSTLYSESLTGVLNRLEHVDLPAFSRSSPDDHAYANAEMHALLVSWIASLRCTVIDRATPHGLFGAAHSIVRWHALAAAAGLTPTTMRLTTSVRRFPAPELVRVPCIEGGGRSTTVLPKTGAFGPALLVEPAGAQTANALVVGESVWVDGPNELAAPARRLARAAGMIVLRVYFSSTPDERGWLFSGAEVLPNVEQPDALAALADVLAPADATRRQGARVTQMAFGGGR